MNKSYKQTFTLAAILCLLTSCSTVNTNIKGSAPSANIENSLDQMLFETAISIAVNDLASKIDLSGNAYYVQVTDHSGKYLPCIETIHYYLTKLLIEKKKTVLDTISNEVDIIINILPIIYGAQTSTDKILFGLMSKETRMVNVKLVAQVINPKNHTIYSNLEIGGNASAYRENKFFIISSQVIVYDRGDGVLNIIQKSY